MWQAMLLSAGIKNTDTVFYHGFVISGGQKMSKSLGNVISPYELVERYGTDATRYLLLRHLHPTEDTDVTWDKLDEWYTAHLANGLGNLASRIMKMASDNLPNPVETLSREIRSDVAEALENFEFQKACEIVWKEIGDLDSYIQEEKPFQTVKEDVETGREQIQFLAGKLAGIATSLRPIMPETSEKILLAIDKNEKPNNLFPRLDA
jgi:methionyl-tRNA synthetase